MMISIVGEIYTDKARSNQDLGLLGWQHLPDWKWQEQSPQIRWLDPHPSPCTKRSMPGHREGMLQTGCYIQDWTHIPFTFVFLLCWGYWWTRGREKDLCVWLLDPFLTFDYSNIHSLKDNDSPQDTQQPGANLLNQTQEVLTFLSLASNTFKSSSYAMKSSGKHLLEAWRQFQRME